MARRIDSSALDSVDKQLCLTSADAAQETTLEDGDVRQTFDIGAGVRRSRAPFGGWFYAAFYNNHTATATRAQFIDPYNVADALTPSRSNLWPSPIPPDLDIWVDAVSFHETLSGSNVTRCTFGIWPESVLQGFGQTLAGSQYTVEPYIPLVNRGALDTIVDPTENESLAAVATPLGFRMPRSGSRLWFGSSVGAVPTTVVCVVTLGLFPLGMGQDVRL